MRVVFRADASPAIGGGHVMRCMTLAEELMRKGHQCILLTHPGTLDVFPGLASRGVEIRATARTAEFTDGEAGEPGADIFVIDHYGMAKSAETSARSHAPVVVFDDKPGRPHDCDLLLDPTFGRRPSDYKPFVPDGAVVLCGPAYALVRSAFAQLRTDAVRRPAPDRLRRISVCFGATNVRGYSETVALALATRFPETTIDLITGSSVSLSDESEAALGVRPSIVRHVDPPNLPEILARSDLAVGSAGSMSWERCCLGLPSIAVPLVDNQRDIANALALTESAAILAFGEEDVAGAVTATTGELDRDPRRRERMAACAAALCDGRGASRLASEIERLAAGRQPAGTEALLRPANESDSLAIWSWRNDFATRRVSENTAPVPWREHDAWYARSLGNPDRLIFIAEATDTNEPVGVVRFDRESGPMAVVSINLAPEARGRGFGSQILKNACGLALAEWPVGRIAAKVRRDNAASERLFLKTGFKPVGPDGDFNCLELARQGFEG